MPALTLFGRNWRVGTDDFVVPGLIDLTVTLVWLVASVIIYWKSDSNFEFMECGGGGTFLKIYLYGVFIILHVTIITTAALIHHSKAGGIMDVEARRFVPPLIYLRLFLQLVQIVWNVLGSVVVNPKVVDMYCSTAPAAIKLVIGFIICNWILIILALSGIYVVFDPLGSVKKKSVKDGSFSCHYRNPDDENTSLSDLPDTKNTRIWTKRLKSYLMATSSSTPMKNALHESGKLFGFVFTDTDLVPTDVTAGWILLTLGARDASKDETALQNLIPVSEKTSVTTTEPESLKTLSLEQLVRDDWMSPRALAHFFKYARACYTWPLVLFGKQPNALRRLFRNAFLCQCCPGRKHPLKVEGDDCCFCHTSGLRELTGMEDEDLIHLSFTNKVFRTPFYIAKDNVTKSIIVAIRGTMSLTDFITDSAAWPMPIDCPGVPPSFKAHHGMALCAKGIKDELMEIVPQMLQENPTYRLVLTGTSLGAGTATILAMMLRPTFPDLRCYAFSPPGGLLSMDAAVFCNDFVISIVYANDIVSRLSIQSIEKLKIAIIDAIKQCKTPKYRIILGGLSYLLGGKKPTTITESEEEQPSLSQEHLIKPNQVSLTIPTTLDDSTNNILKICDNNHMNSKNGETKIDLNNAKNRILVSTKEKRVPCCQLWPPGLVVFITETPEFHSGRNKTDPSGQQQARWRIRWADRTEFSEIIVHERIVGDHLPFRLHKSLQVLAMENRRIAPIPSLISSKCSK